MAGNGRLSAAILFLVHTQARLDEGKGERARASKDNTIRTKAFCHQPCERRFGKRCRDPIEPGRDHRVVGFNQPACQSDPDSIDEIRFAPASHAMPALRFPANLLYAPPVASAWSRYTPFGTAHISSMNAPFQLPLKSSTFPASAC